MIRKFITSYKLTKFYSKLIHKGFLCFDIGANVGAKSIIFLKNGAKVIAFEPQKSCLPSLQKIAEKQNDTTFKYFIKGIDITAGTRELYLSNHSEIATFSKTFKNTYNGNYMNWDKKETVETVTLNSCIQQFGVPHFCKIDVEGYECEILTSLKYNIPIIEFEFLAGFLDKVLPLIELISDTNTRFNYTKNENSKFEIKEWVDSNKIIEIIKTFPKDKFHTNIFVKKMNIL